MTRLSLWNISFHLLVHTQLQLCGVSYFFCEFTHTRAHTHTQRCLRGMLLYFICKHAGTHTHASTLQRLRPSLRSTSTLFSRKDKKSCLRVLRSEWRPVNSASITVSLQTQTSDSSLSARAWSVQTGAPEERYSMTPHGHPHTHTHADTNYKWYSCLAFLFQLKDTL